MKTELKAVSNQSNQELATLANCAAAWKGDELLNSTYWNYQLTSVEVWEIEAAIRNLNHPHLLHHLLHRLTLLIRLHLSS